MKLQKWNILFPYAYSLLPVLFLFTVDDSQIACLLLLTAFTSSLVGWHQELNTIKTPNKGLIGTKEL